MIGASTCGVIAGLVLTQLTLGCAGDCPEVSASQQAGNTAGGNTPGGSSPDGQTAAEMTDTVARPSGYQPDARAADQGLVGGQFIHGPFVHDRGQQFIKQWALPVSPAAVPPLRREKP